MTTRSGLVIRTMPMVRPSASLQTCSSDLPRCGAAVDTAASTHAVEWRKNSGQLVRYKSMSYLSFVTRFHLIQNGTQLDVSGNPQDTEEWAEKLPYAYSKDM